MSQSQLTDAILGTWMFCGGVLFLYNWLNVPVQLTFLLHRRAQLCDGNFDLRPTTPTHALLHYYCAIMYGIAVPVFFFATARVGHALGPYYLGPMVCQDGLYVVGLALMAWLLVHVIRGIAAGDRLRFGGWVDRIFAGAGLAYCLWFHAWTLSEFQVTMSKFRNGPHEPLGYAVFFVYEQSLIFGATLVYGFALLEARRAAKSIAFTAGLRPRQWAWRAGVFALMLAPWWLSLPHTSHRRAIALIGTHREKIASLAKEAEIDPRLLAGIVYVSQTRMRSRLTGDLMDQLGVEVAEDNDIIAEFSPIIAYNEPIGLCQIRPKDYLNICIRGEMNEFGRPKSEPRIKLKWAPKMIGEGNYRAEGEMVRELLSPDTNLRTAAAMLYLLRDQWRSAGFKAADDPAILATIFSGGIENSRPEVSPKPNDFGRRVKAFMESDDCRRALEAKNP